MSADPSWHREKEKQFTDHVRGLLADSRLRLPTQDGMTAVTALQRRVEEKDREVDLKRLMQSKGVYDYDIQGKMPLGRELHVTLKRRSFFLFWRMVGDFRCVNVSPSDDLLTGAPARPADAASIKAALDAIPWLSGVPQTVVLCATGGFTDNARDFAGKRGDRALILVEPSPDGGWKIHAPPELKELVTLLDPEDQASKIVRIRQEIDAAKGEMLAGGISSSRIVARTQLQADFVEREIKAYAAEQGLAAKKIEGELMIYREGSGLNPLSGGAHMPFLDRLKSLFSIKGETEKKISLLSERRAALAKQRDQAFEEMDTLEKQESSLKDQFKNTTSNLTRKRLTSQLLQLRKDLERRQQVLGVLNQQINVVGAHLHNLELVQQGSHADMPDSEEMATDAAKAEEVLAELQANAEVASELTSIGPAGMSDEEQALFEELSKEMGIETEKPDIAIPQQAPKASEKAPQTPTANPPTPQQQKNRQAQAE